MLKIKDLHKNYGKKCVLNGITFDTEHQVIGLLGPNGAGKTTLIKIIVGILKNTSGEVLYKDQMGQCNTLENVRIGYLPQSFGLIKNYTLYEHLEYFACIRGMKKEEWGEEIDHILEMVHLEEMKNVKCGKLSGGMIRRAGIAQAFLGNPDIVLLDEPTTGLDPEERIRFQNLISYYSKKCIIIISTHILDDVSRVCEELLVMDKGSLLYHGETSGLLSLARDRVFVMTEEESHHWQDYGINIKTLCGEKDNMVRFLYLQDDSYVNPKAKKADSQIEDGYMYLLKKSRGQNEL